MYQVEMQLYRDHLIERFKRRNSVKMSPPPPGLRLTLSHACTNGKFFGILRSCSRLEKGVYTVHFK